MYIAGSSTCSTKELFIQLTKKENRNIEKLYSRSGINHMWILKNSFGYLFEFWLKNMWNCTLIQQIWSHRFYDWKLCEWFLLSGFLICHEVGWYTELTNGYNSTYFSTKIQKDNTCYPEEQVISLLEFLIDNIFVSFGGTLFQQVVSIPMGYKCIFRYQDLVEKYSVSTETIINDRFL
jgi:hypothetical protein